ncbi:MAG: hypothetical protein V1857_03180 [archaeon]
MTKRCLECGTDNEDYAESCVGCGSSLVEVTAPATSGVPQGSVVVDLPPGSGAVRTQSQFFKIKGPPRSKIAFLLGFIATLLVFLDSYLIGLAGATIPIPVSISPLIFAYFPTDIVGIVLAFVMLLACLMILGRKEITGGATLLTLSLLSVALGGGFGIGFLLGIVGSLLAFLKK